jgi:hypothetical protein
MIVNCEVSINRHGCQGKNVLIIVNVHQEEEGDRTRATAVLQGTFAIVKSLRRAHA